jgi:Tfp pilus assembly protein PilW
MQQKGMSIIEAVVVLAIMGVMVVGLGSLFIWQSSLYALEAKRVDVERAHNLALERLVNDVREARFVTSSYGGYTSATSTLVLQVPIDAVAISTTEFDHIIYTFLASTGLRRIVYAASSSNRMTQADTVDPYTTATSGVQFIYNLTPPKGSTVVTVSLVSTGTVRNKNYVLTDTEELNIRN